MKEKIKSRVFLSWVLSYLLILLMPLCMGTFVYHQAIRTIQQEVEMVNVAALRQTQSAVDANLAEFSRVSGSLSLNQDIRALLSLKKDLTARDMPTVMKVQDELAKFVITDSMLEEIFVYVHSQRYMLSSSYKYGEDEIEKVCTTLFGLPYEAFLQLSRSRHYPPFRILQTPQLDGTQRASLLYISPLFSYNYTKPMGMLVIKISTDRFMGLLKAMEVTGQGEVVLVNHLDEACSTSPRHASHPQWRFEELGASALTFTQPLDGEDTTIAHVRSDAGDVEYLSLIPTSMFLHKVSRIKQMIGWYVALCLLLGGVAAWLFAKRYYGPVERMKKLLMHRLSTVENSQRTENEFALMERSLLTLLENESRFHDVMEKQSQAQRSNVLARILKGRMGASENVASLLSAHKISFEGECFAVATVFIEEAEEKMLQSHRDDQDMHSLICSIIQNAGEEALGESYAAFMAEVDGVAAFIISAGDDSAEKVCDECAQILERMAVFIRQSFSITLSVCLSSVQYGLEGIAEAYSETLLAHEYRAFVCETETVIRFDLLKQHQHEPVSDAFSPSNQRLLGNCLTTHDHDGARRLFEQLISRDQKAVSSVQLMKIRAFALVNMALNAAREVDGAKCSAFLESREPLEALLGARTAAELREQAISFFGDLLIALEDPGSRQTPDCIRDAEAYVADHICEPELNVAAIADALGLSTPYLSRTYKRFRGIGLLEHIHIQRLEIAKKELLRGQSIAQVASLVGYYDAKALIRVFKRYEGITPGQMKKNQKA